MSIDRPSLYAGHRHSVAVIAHAVWPYFRFPLSLRMVEEMLAERGVVVSHETIRRHQNDRENYAMDQTRRNSSASHGNSPVGGFAALVPELDVTDLNVSLKFWCELLGFDVAYTRPAARFAYLQRESLQIMLCQINGEWMTSQLEAPFGRGVNFQMTVPDLDPVLKNLQKHGWPLFRPVQEKNYRVGDKLSMSREILVQDPDGYLLRFAQNC